MENNRLLFCLSGLRGGEAKGEMGRKGDQKDRDLQDRPGRRRGHAEVEGFFSLHCINECAAVPTTAPGIIARLGSDSLSGILILHFLRHYCFA